jgi:hypothetical protein
VSNLPIPRALDRGHGLANCLCAAGLPADAQPEMNKLLDSRLGYYIRPGKHAMTRADWEVFVKYADKYFIK